VLTMTGCWLFSMLSLTCNTQCIQSQSPVALFCTLASSMQERSCSDCVTVYTQPTIIIVITRISKYIMLYLWYIIYIYMYTSCTYYTVFSFLFNNRNIHICICINGEICIHGADIYHGWAIKKNFYSRNIIHVITFGFGAAASGSVYLYTVYIIYVCLYDNKYVSVIKTTCRYII